MAQKLLRDLIWDRFGIHTRTRENWLGVGIVAGNIERVLPRDPNRIGLFIMNTSDNLGGISITRAPAGALTLQLAANGGFVSMWYGEDFDLVGQDFWALSLGVGPVWFYTLEELIETE